MKITKTIPAEDKTLEVTRLIFDLDQPKQVIGFIGGPEGTRDSAVDITPIIREMTATQKNIVKGFFLAVGAILLESDSNAIDEGDLFNVDKVEGE